MQEDKHLQKMQQKVLNVLGPMSKILLSVKLIELKWACVDLKNLLSNLLWCLGKCLKNNI